MDLANRVLRLEVNEESFVPEGETKPIKYNKSVIVCKSNDEEFEVAIKLTRDQVNLLRLADEV